MKNKIIYLLVAAFILGSCNFLDVVPDDTPTLRDAFANETTSEAFLFGVYSFMADPRNWRARPGRLTTNEMKVSGHWDAQWFPFMRFQRNEFDASSPLTTDVNNFDVWNDIWLNNYRAIRQAYIFLDNIGAVVPSILPPATFNARREEWRGEAYFLIAWLHHELFKNFGPIVIADEIITGLRPRSHINDVVDFIVEMYDRAIALLPVSQPLAQLGRADRIMAKTMRAQLLLYAASPLFNGDPAGVFNDAEPEFRALINTERDNARWQRALTAIDEAINFAHANGRALFRHVGPDPVTGQPVTDPLRQGYLNVRRKFVENWNSETLWGHGGGRRIEGGRWIDHTVPRGLGGRPNTLAGVHGTGIQLHPPASGRHPHTPGIGPSLTAAMIFYSVRGLPMESDPDRNFPWTPAGRMGIGTTPHGTQTANLFINREPRFHAAIGYHGGIFEINNWEEEILDMFWTPGGATQNLFSQGRIDGVMDRIESGLVSKKTTPPTIEIRADNFDVQMGQAFPMMRLAGLYLAYAEAHAELHGNLSARARGFIADIHERAGLSRNFFFANYTGTALIDAIRRERMIELIFESHWHYDLRRWQIAYQWHNEGMWASAGMHDRDGIWGLNPQGTTNDTFFQETQVAGGGALMAPVRFHNRQHLLPIPNPHLFVNELLVQNPGY